MPKKVYIEHKGERLCLSEWARRLGITHASFQQRLDNYSVEEAIEGEFKSNNKKQKTGPNKTVKKKQKTKEMILSDLFLYQMPVMNHD